MIWTCRRAVVAHVCKYGPKHSSFRRSSSSFYIKEHVTRCQHTRERQAAAELGRENELGLVVKQYIPKDNTKPASGDVTFIAAHANGFPKEMYEPLWEDIYKGFKANGKSIRGIWIADIVSQGRSGVLNEELLGPDPSWWDHARDLLFLINQYQDEMPHPLIGIGHSMGGTHLAHLSLLHPRLLDALILIDPVIQRENPSKPYALASTYRRDTWPSLAHAIESYKAKKFYQRWDPRVLEKWTQFGLREAPSELPATDKTGDLPAILVTPKAQEVFTFLRPAYHDDRMLQDEGHIHDEMLPEDIDDYPFYRPEPAAVSRRLPELRPDILYIFGNQSELSAPEERQRKLQATGTGLGGSGGITKGRVQEVVLDCGHLVPMERVTETADAVVAFSNTEINQWTAQTQEFKRRWQQFSRSQKTEINDAWRKNIGSIR